MRGGNACHILNGHPFQMLVVHTLLIEMERDLIFLNFIYSIYLIKFDFDWSINKYMV